MKSGPLGGWALGSVRDLPQPFVFSDGRAMLFNCQFCRHIPAARHIVYELGNLITHMGAEHPGQRWMEAWYVIDEEDLP